MDRLGLRRGRRGWGGIAGGDFTNGEAGGSGFGDRPEEGGALIERDEALGGGGEALGEADGDSGVDGEGEVDVCAEEGAGEWVEKSGVDEGGVGADGEAGQDEVDVLAAHAVGEVAQEGGVEGVGAERAAVSPPRRMTARALCSRASWAAEA